MKDVVIVGGGLAGLISSILLVRSGFSVTLIEKKSYPFHRVCGEYVSNEVIPFLKQNELYPEALEPAVIDTFELTDPKGNFLSMPLDLGGFGISRYAFDHWLYQKACEEGVDVQEKTNVLSIDYLEDSFKVGTNRGNQQAKYVIGSYGKRSALDRQLKRPFFFKKSPYIGVKYHVKTDLATQSAVALHNFKGGYCGVNRVENNTFNLCYLSERSNLEKYGTIPEMEESVLKSNPKLRSVFEASDFLFEKPEVINEITFSPKEPVFDHVLMTGDAAGMITPLCGNGMAMAIHGAKMLVEQFKIHMESRSSRTELEQGYSRAWKKTFDLRHWAGRQIQHTLFGSQQSATLALWLGKKSPLIANWLMSKTHGIPF